MNWNIENKDIEKISNIADRFIKLLPGTDKMAITMDITACHLNGCELDLDRMINTDDTTLIHDVVGIHNNIDHNTGKLSNCFLPKLSL